MTGWDYLGLAVVSEHVFAELVREYDAAFEKADQSAMGVAAGEMIATGKLIDESMGTGWPSFAIPGGRHCGPFNFFDDGKHEQTLTWRHAGEVVETTVLIDTDMAPA